MQDPVLEAILAGHDVPFHYEPRLELDQIDITDDARRNIRFMVDHGVIPDAVDRYMMTYERNGQMPPIVVAQVNGEGPRCTMVDGIQRTTALRKLGRSATDAYIVESEDPVVIHRLQRSLNTRHGEGFNKEQATTQAMFLVRFDNYSIERAAELLQVSPRTVQDRVTAERMRDQLNRLGITDELAEPVLLALHTLVTGRRVHLPELARVAAAVGLTAVAVKEIVKRLNDAETDEHAAGMMQQWVSEQNQRRARKGGRNKREPKPLVRQLATAVQQVARLLDDLRPEHWEALPPAERQRIQVELRRVGKLLIAEGMQSAA